jgi:Ca-activated chloride channel family protein
MELLDDLYLPIVYLTICIIVIGSLIKFFFLSQIQRFLKANPSLTKKFPVPNIFLYTLAASLLIASLIFSFIALHQTEANEAALSENKNSVDVLFIIDVSLSMNATDVFPSRINRMQDILLRIAPDLSGNRVGIIVFAGSAFSYCPMTTDITAFADYVNAIGVDMIGKKGTDISTAFNKATATLSSTKLLKNRVVVFISDGEDHESSKLQKIDADVVVWGIGTNEGGPIYFGEENSKSAGYVTKSGGLTPNENSDDLLITKLNETSLKAIAEKNQGDYYDLSRESYGSSKLLDKISDMKKNQTVLLQKIKKEDGAGKFLILAVVCLFINRILRFFFISKQALLLLACLFFISNLQNLYAWELDPGGNLVEDGVKLFKEKKYSESTNKFKEAEEYFSEDSRLKFNQANDDYMLEKYTDSIKKNQIVIEDPNTPSDMKAKALYNNGNAYFKLKNLKSAQKYYEEALNLDPMHLGAKKNLELLRKKNPSSKQNQEENQSSENQKSRNQQGNKQSKNDKSKSRDAQDAKENAERMMDHFSPDSILRKKSNGGGFSENEKFW